MRTALRITIAAVVVIAATAVFFFLTPGRRQSGGVSLTFQRYSDHDLYVDHVAYLWLTNASNKRYFVAMPGNSNTLALGNIYHPERYSYLIDGEFSDQTATGWSNWIQQDLPLGSARTTYLALSPGSGLRIRVPLQKNGRPRKAAVFYEEQSTNISKIWTSRLGLDLLVRLPPSLQSKVLQPKTLWHEVWCDRELLYPSDPKAANPGLRPGPI